MRQLKITKSITNRESASLDKYLQEIGREELISVSEEVELAQRIKKGDHAALEKLTRANLRFVVSVAKQYQNQGLSLPDLINEGNLGLIRAAQKFDETRGFKFISYAVWWIRQSILKAICEKSRPIRLPLNRANELVRIEHAKKELYSTGLSLNEEDEITEVANMLNMDSTHVREMINISKEMASLDSEIYGKDNSYITMGEMLEDTRYAAPDTKLIEEDMNRELNDVIDTLKPNEAQVLRMRYGLDGQKPMSLKEVGEAFDLTKERIRQIEKIAIKRMRCPVRARRLSSYVA